MRRAALLPALLALVLAGGCARLPEEPGPEAFSSTETLSGGLVERYAYPPDRAGTRTGRNLLLVIADASIQDGLRDRAEGYLGRAAPEGVGLEELSWWHYSPLLGDVYGEVHLIRRDGARYRVVREAVGRLERTGVPYDIILLTHGLPNHISSGRDHFLSWREIGGWRGRLDGLNLVFMQGCFGSTLAGDWLEAGAGTVIAHEGLNTNFLYLSSFLKRYRRTPGDVPAAWAAANRSHASNVRNSPLYRTVIRELLDSSVEEHLETIATPLLFQAGPAP